VLRDPCGGADFLGCMLAWLVTMVDLRTLLCAVHEDPLLAGAWGGYGREIISLLPQYTEEDDSVVLFSPANVALASDNPNWT